MTRLVGRSVLAGLAAVLCGGCGLFGTKTSEFDRLEGTRVKAGPAGWGDQTETITGEVLVRAVVSDFVDRAAKDPRVNFDRNGKYKFTAEQVAKLKDTLVAQISSVTGGSIPYEGRPMKDVHAGMKITDDEFDALADDLIWAFNKYKVPKSQQSRLLTIIGGTRGDIVEVPRVKPAGK
jgi:hemoglobin